jgi:HEAT repeat protein
MAWTTIRVLLCVFIGTLSMRAPRVSAQAEAPPVQESGSKGEEAFKKALAKLKSSDPAERAAAADEMGRRGYRFRKIIADNLRPLLLNDPESIVRAAAGRALGRLGAREAVPELIKALKDKTSEVRVVAAAALWRLPDPNAVPALLECVKDGDKAVREWAALALGVAADARATSELIRLLDDPERAVRLAAVRSLGRLNEKDALKPLTQYLASGKRDDEEKEEVVNSIASIDGPERSAALLGLLGAAGKDEKLRLHVVLALGKVGDAQALPTLRKLGTRDNSRGVRDAAAQAYASVLGRSRARPDAGADAAKP